MDPRFSHFIDGEERLWQILFSLSIRAEQPCHSGLKIVGDVVAIFGNGRDPGAHVAALGSRGTPGPSRRLRSWRRRRTWHWERPETLIHRRSANRASRPPRSMPPRFVSSAISGRGSTAATRRRSSSRRCRSSPRSLPGCRAATDSSRCVTSQARSNGPRHAAIRPNDYEMRAIDDDRDASLPPDLMATLYRRYETAKARAGRIDFEDMLELTIGLIESDDDDRGRGARPLSLVLGRRVPGHEPAPGGAPRRVARRAAGPRGRGRRGPDDLHVHRREQRLPDRLRGSAIRTRGS